MGEAAIPLDDNHTGQSGGPELELVSTEGPERPFFDYRDLLQGEDLPEPVIDHQAFLKLIKGNATHANKTIGLTQLAFKAFAGQTGIEAETIPSFAELEEQYHQASFLFASRSDEKDFLLEEIDAVIEPFDKKSPIHAARLIAKSETLFEIPKVSLLVVKLWLIDKLGLGDKLPASYDMIKNLSPNIPRPRLGKESQPY